MHSTGRRVNVQTVGEWEWCRRLDGEQFQLHIRSCIPLSGVVSCVIIKTLSLAPMWWPCKLLSYYEYCP